MRSISGVVITYNEEASIRDCLESLKFVDEIIVVDSCSSDRTVEIAKSYTDKVFTVEWKGYAASRNFGIDQARNDWIFSLDADERVSDELRESILSQDLDACAGYWISRRTWYLGKWIRGGGWYPDRHIRLFNRLQGRFTPVPVHEHVDIQSNTGRLSGDILHYSYRDISDHVQRINRYSSLASERWIEKGRRATPARMVLRCGWEVFRSYVLRAGFRDGREGIILAGMHAYYTFLKYAKTIEHRRRHNKD